MVYPLLRLTVTAFGLVADAVCATGSFSSTANLSITTPATGSIVCRAYLRLISYNNTDSVELSQTCLSEVGIFFR
jgi:hypothetical protein